MMTVDDVDRIIAAALGELDDDQREYLTKPIGINPVDFADFPAFELQPHQVAVVRFVLTLVAKQPQLASLTMRVQPAGTVFGTIGFHAALIVRDIQAAIEASGKNPDIGS